MSPRTLMTGVKLDFKKHYRVAVGAYVQTHEFTQPRNDVEKSRTTGAIALEHTGNVQGGYKFLSLNTGRIIVRDRWTPLPVTDEVIRRVHELADKEDHNFVFLDRVRTPIDD